MSTLGALILDAVSSLFAPCSYPAAAEDSSWRQQRARSNGGGRYSQISENFVRESMPATVDRIIHH